jgi:hypothetical protein
MKRKIIICILVLGVVVGGVYGYYRYKFPYGNTHRCSKILAGMLDQYAADHEGRYPQADDDHRLGLEKVLEVSRDQLAMVVGKAGDLEEAEKFYKKSGFLLKGHSSWHYVSGLTTADEGRALAWDKVPLTHNGMRISYNPREVIMVGGLVEQINESRWEDFLKQQEQIATEKKEANKTSHSNHH